MLSLKYINVIKRIVFGVLFFLSSCGSDVDYPIEEENPKEFDLRDKEDEDSGSGFIAELTSGYSSKVDEYLLDIDINKKKYIQDVTETDSVKTTSDISYEIISRYAQDSDSITESEWQILQNTNQGYKGVGLYNETEDKYSYDTNKKQAEEFETFSYDFLDQKYREDLVDEVIDEKKKTRYKALLASNEAQSQIQEYSNK